MASDQKSILLIGNYPPPYGGVPRHFEYLVPYLVQRGWKVHILSAGDDGTVHHDGFTVYKPTDWQRRWARLVQRLHQQQPKQAMWETVRQTAPADWLRYITYIALARRIIEQHHIQLISAYNMYSYAPIGAYLSEQYGIPLVVTNFGEFYSQRTFFDHNPQLTPYVCQHSTRLLAMSQHCANSYSELELHPVVQVLRYGVDLKLFHPTHDGSSIRQRFGLKTNDFVVLFLGRLCRDMGLDTMLQAIPKIIQQSPAIKFLIAGENGDLTAELATLAQSYPQHIHTAAHVSFNELPLFYAAATVMVAPTQGARACGSLSALEAMATAKPVIAADIGGIPEIVTDGVTGRLIKPQQSSELAQVIIELFQQPNQLQSYGQAGRKRVEQDFNEQLLDTQFEELFLSLIKP